MGSASNSLPSYLPNHLSVTQKKKKRPKNKRERERREGPRQSKEKILVFFAFPAPLPSSLTLRRFLIKENRKDQCGFPFFSFFFCFEKKKESKRSTFSIRFQFVFFSLCFSRSIKIGNYVYYMESEKTMV